MPGLVAGMMTFLLVTKVWVAGTSPAMTNERFVGRLKTARELTRDY
jgi:hypothetical protein